jgi:hypothetical protein
MAFKALPYRDDGWGRLLNEEALSEMYSDVDEFSSSFSVSMPSAIRKVWEGKQTRPGFLPGIVL